MVIMYADQVTDSMERAISETYRRREIQQAYNKEHGIVPKTIIKNVRDVLEISVKSDDGKSKGKVKKGKPAKRMTAAEKEAQIAQWTLEMKNAAKLLEFEHAAYLRDKIKKLKES